MWEVKKTLWMYVSPTRLLGGSPDGLSEWALLNRADLPLNLPRPPKLRRLRRNPPSSFWGSMGVRVRG